MHLLKTHVFISSKTGEKESKNNYGPVSILSSISKVFERCIFRYQIVWVPHYQNISADLGKVAVHNFVFYLRFRNGNVQVDNGKAFGLLLVDLSKAFDCLFYEFHLVKLYVYGFSFAALQPVYRYSTNRKHRT